MGPDAKYMTDTNTCDVHFLTVRTGGKTSGSLFNLLASGGRGVMFSIAL